MPGPFPGMDPYLEHAVRWAGFHQGLITAIAWNLNALLPERYVASMGERLYVVETARSIFPDAAVQERPSDAAPAERGGVATLAPMASDVPWILPDLDGEYREVFVQILSAEDESRVISLVRGLRRRASVPPAPRHSPVTPAPAPSLLRAASAAA
jgi:hypothetical protein